MKYLDKKVWLLAWPLLLSNLTAPLLGLVDTAVVGHLSSPSYLASVALASNYFMLLYFSLNFLRMSSSGMAAQAHGRGHSGFFILMRALLLALFLGSVLIAFNAKLSQLALELLGGSAEIQALAKEYINVRIWAAPAALANYVLIGFAVGIGQTRIALKTTVLMHSVNALLSYLLVYYAGLDVKGVAAASAIADGLGMLAALYYLRAFVDYKKLLQLSLKRLFDGPAIMALLSLNRDLFVRSLLLLGVFFFFTAQGARFGDTVLAANAILITFLLLLSSILDAFANAAEALVGKAVGENNPIAVKQSVKDTAIWTVFVALVCLLAFILFAPLSIVLLTDLPEVRKAALVYLPWLCLLPVTASIGFWLDGVFVGAMQARVMRDTMIMSVLGFFIIWFFSQSLANHGLWLAMNGLMLLRSVLMPVFWHKIISGGRFA